MEVSFTQQGNFNRTLKWLTRLERQDFYNRVNAIAATGTAALRAATPVESGATASAWSHQVIITKTSCGIIWYNSHTNNGVNIAIILQYGHGTGTGGYVAGRNYINPAIKPIFDRIDKEVWSEVTKDA